MTDHTSVANVGSRDAIARTNWPEVLERRLLADRLARYVFALGGWSILLSICAILFVILMEVVPLFVPASIEEIETRTISKSTLGIFLDDYKEIGVTIDHDGAVNNFSYGTLEKYQFDAKENVRFTALHAEGSDILLGTESGQAVKARVSFSPRYNDGVRTIVPSLGWQSVYPVLGSEHASGQPIQRIAFGSTRKGEFIAAQYSPTEIELFQRQESKGLMGGGSSSDRSISITVPSSTISSLALDQRVDYLLVGTNSGDIYAYALKGTLDASSLQRYQASDTPITTIEFSLGGRTVLIGERSGAVSSWLFARHADSNQLMLKKVNTFAPHSSAIQIIETSQRNKIFASVDVLGTVQLHYATTGKTLITIPSPLTANQKVAGLRLAPKSDGIYLHTTDGTVYGWHLAIPHPEISMKTLFAPVHYEGFNKPEYVWQSTGGSDDFEPKLSVIPLLVGTMKGTLYALLFAVPLAILAAFYASQFMSPRVKSIIKPSLEVMAALPSVVIGFVAGLWLAPALEPYLVAIFCIPICITIALVCTCMLFWKLGASLGISHRTGIELAIAMPIIAGAIYLAFPLASLIESLFFSGSFNQWLYDTHGIRVDQRNSIIAGIAVGFAVIPIIFTIAEDCLSSVPKALSAGSLALGATRWQTALKVIFPVAAPGIFAAVMIGLGRAVGETMIVLMATGNTPLLDLSAFTGFRALSANIAVELPEAPHGGTLYRVLFLTALILFVITFLLNTISEFVRSRLRKKFGGV